MRIFSKQYLVSSVRASVALAAAIVTNEQLQKEFSDYLINLTLEKNKELYKGPIISPLGFVARAVARNIADVVELATIYDLEECSSPIQQQTLIGAINLTSTATGLSFNEILNIRYDNEMKTLPTINNRIMLALDRSVDKSDSVVKQTLQAFMSKVSTIAEATDASEELQEALLAKSSRYKCGHSGAVLLLTDFTPEEVSPFDNKQPNEF